MFFPRRSSAISDVRTALVVGITALILATACTPTTETSTADEGDTAGPEISDEDFAFATVDRVVDGDTVSLIIDGSEERVRLIGIDAPESVDRNSPIHCYGPEASTALKELLPEGTEVYVLRDVEARDRYDRLLLYIYRSSDDLFVNEWLVSEGYAEARGYRPNTTLQPILTEARDDAVENGRGLWGVCDGPEQPLE